jgi:16S rRNA G966 N2-methylase RsmD
MNHSQSSNSDMDNLTEFVSDGQINIPRKEMKALVDQVGKKNRSILVDEAVALIEDGTLSFPYKSAYTTDEEIVNEFRELQNHSYKTINPPKMEIKRLNLKNPNLLKYQGRYVVVLYSLDDYIRFGSITDYFQEEIRVKSQRADHTRSQHRPDTTLECWTQKARVIVNTSIFEFKELTSHSLREAIFKKFYGVGTFRLSVARSVMQMFKATHVLDPCAGWGDRLVAALSCPNVVSYCGVDPNRLLFAGYKKMCNMFNRDREPVKVRMIDRPFEDADIPDDKFNLVFTSPPYFDWEQYHTDDKSTQSIVRYPDLDVWLKSFLFPMLSKSWNALVSGGYMVIVINDIGDHEYVERMIEYGSTLTGSDYRGCIGYGPELNEDDSSFGECQPMWVWRKN